MTLPRPLLPGTPVRTAYGPGVIKHVWESRWHAPAYSVIVRVRSNATATKERVKVLYRHEMRAR